MTFYLEKIVPTSAQVNFLYKQMKSRVHKISHNSLPSLSEHTQFVRSNFYREWFIIKNGVLNIGNVYVQSDNSIGLYCYSEMSSSKVKIILELVLAQVEPLEAIPSLRRDHFFMNVASSNSHLQESLTSIGCLEIQRSYVILDFVQAKTKEK